MLVCMVAALYPREFEPWSTQTSACISTSLFLSCISFAHWYVRSVPFPKPQPSLLLSINRHRQVESNTDTKHTSNLSQMGSHNTQRMEIYSLREQIKGTSSSLSSMIPNEPLADNSIANLAVLDIAKVEATHIVISKPQNNSSYTAWALSSTGKPIIRGPSSDTVGASLEMLLDATAELVAEKLVDCVDEYNKQANQANGDGVAAVADGGQAAETVESGAITGATGSVASSHVTNTGAGARERSFTSTSGHVYRTTDGSCCGYGPEREVTYCAG